MGDTLSAKPSTWLVEDIRRSPREGSAIFLELPWDKRRYPALICSRRPKIRLTGKVGPLAELVLLGCRSFLDGANLEHEIFPL